VDPKSAPAGTLDKFDRGARTDTPRHPDRFKEVVVFQTTGISKIYI
jgi:hypothetical protein